MNYETWIGKQIEKKSGKPFKDGCKISIARELTTNPFSGHVAFLITDGTVVNCQQCKLVETKTV